MKMDQLIMEYYNDNLLLEFLPDAGLASFFTNDNGSFQSTFLTMT